MGHKLYISIDYKDKEQICGSIYNRPRNLKDEIWIRYEATRVSENVFELDLYKHKKDSHIKVNLEENFDCRMVAKDILFYVEQRIEHIFKAL